MPSAGKVGRLFRPFQGTQKEGEFISAKTCNGVAFFGPLRETYRRLLEEKISVLVAQRIVDFLEAVERNQHECAHLPTIAGAGERLFQAIQKERGVREGRKGIEVRKIVSLGIAFCRSLLELFFIFPLLQEKLVVLHRPINSSR